MRLKEFLDWTDDPSLYRLLRRELEMRKKGGCSRDRPHRGENRARPPGRASWKDERRRRWRRERVVVLEAGR